MNPQRRSDPRTKEQVLDRMLSYDFDGDIRNLGSGPASLSRTAPNKLLLTFEDSGITYEIVVRRPREEQSVAASEGRSFRAEPEEEEAPKRTAAKRTRKGGAQASDEDWSADFKAPARRAGGRRGQN